MISEMPLPSPRSVMSSPSHTRNIVPATMDATMAKVWMFRPKSTPGSTPDCLRMVSCPHACRNAIGTASQCVYWLRRWRPLSPSCDSALRLGMTGVSICITMDEVM